MKLAPGYLLLATFALAAPAAAQDLPVAQVAFVAGPDVSAFAQTTAITEIDVTSNGVNILFDKKTGANAWPSNTTPGWSGPLQFSIGMCLNSNGWTCSAPVEVWAGEPAAGGPIQDNTVTCPAGYHGQVACNWFYDQRWGSLNGYQPAPGERVGMYVVAGDARNSYNPVRERSNIVTFAFPAPNTTPVYLFAVPPDPTPMPPVVTPPAPTPAGPPAPAATGSDTQQVLAAIADLKATMTDQHTQQTNAVKSIGASIASFLKDNWPTLATAIATYIAGKKL